MSIKNKQHYLSKFYLKNFSKITGFDFKNKPIKWEIYYINLIENRKIDKDEISNIARQNKLFSLYENGEYNDELENIFSKEENYYSEIVRKVKNNINSIKNNEKGKMIEFTDKDINYLIKFIFFQNKRSIVVNNNNIEEGNKIIKNAENIYGELSEEEKKEFLHYFNNYIGSKIFNDEKFLNTLKSKNISLYYINDNISTNFITSDFPIYRYSPTGDEGIQYSDMELSFPITEKILIFFSGSNNKKINYIEITDDNIIDDFNKKTIANATNLIIGSNERQVNELGNLIQSNVYSKNILF